MKFENGLYTFDSKEIENVDIPFMQFREKEKIELYHFKKSLFTLEFTTKFFNKYNVIREKINCIQKKEEVNILELEKEIRKLLLSVTDLTKDRAIRLEFFEMFNFLNDFIFLLNDNDYLQRKNLLFVMNKLKDKLNDEEKKRIYEIMRQNKELLYEILDYDILDKEKYDKTFETNIEDTALQLWGEYKKKIQKK